MLHPLPPSMPATKQATPYSNGGPPMARIFLFSLSLPLGFTTALRFTSLGTLLSSIHTAALNCPEERTFQSTTLSCHITRGRARPITATDNTRRAPFGTSRVSRRKRGRFRACPPGPGVALRAQVEFEMESRKLFSLLHRDRQAALQCQSVGRAASRAIRCAVPSDLTGREWWSGRPEGV